MWKWWPCLAEGPYTCELIWHRNYPGLGFENHGSWNHWQQYLMVCCQWPDLIQAAIWILSKWKGSFTMVLGLRQQMNLNGINNTLTRTPVVFNLNKFKSMETLSWLPSNLESVGRITNLRDQWRRETVASCLSSHYTLPPPQHILLSLTQSV